jgi:hypothetical protein
MVTHACTVQNSVRLALNSCFLRGANTKITPQGRYCVRQLPKREPSHMHVSLHILFWHFCHVSKINFLCQSFFLCFVDCASLYNIVNKANLVHNFSSMFISFLYAFWVTMCPSSGETTVSMWHLVFVILYGWPSGMQGPPCIPDSHPYRITNTKCRISGFGGLGVTCCL